MITFRKLLNKIYFLYQILSTFDMLKWILIMKLKKKLSSKQFILSHLLILIIGLICLGTLYFILNIQYKSSSNPFFNGPVTSKPKSFTLTLDQPADESLSFNPSILVSGKTSPHLDVLISTDDNDQVIEAKSDGTFSLTLTLNEGVNNIKIVAFDQTGDVRETSKLVYYSKEKLQ